MQANLSPLYFLYRDPDGEIRRSDRRSRRAAGSRSRRGTRWAEPISLTAIADAALHARLSAAFAHRTLFVADGHHRYEAALAYRDECRARHGYDPDAPWEFVLALLAAVEDPGVIVRPTHRVLIDDRNGSPRQVLQLLQRWFDVGAAQLAAAAAGRAVHLPRRAPG